MSPGELVPTMAAIRLRGPELTFDDPTLVEGFPGIGLVGKIAADHLIDQFEMEYYASVHCEGLPEIAVYGDGERGLRAPVRIYASEAHDLLALQSDVPIAAQAVGQVADCLSGWLDANDVTPVYISGLPAERDGVPELYGVATGDAGTILDDVGVQPPGDDGAISGPTGALLSRAVAADRDSVGLIVESSPQFPDPEAAKVLIERGIAPMTGLDVDVSDLVERAEEIRSQREQLAKQMQEIGREESTQARPMQMFQ